MLRLRQFVADFYRECWTIVIPLVFITDMSLGLWLLGFEDAAWVVGNMGALMVMGANLVYVMRCRRHD